MANIAFNPYAITNVQDSFSVQSQGYWQGDILDDPSARFQLAAGVVAATEGAPMWGGLAVYEATPAAGNAATGQVSTIGRATNAGAISGFSTFKGVIAAPVTPSSTVPLQASGGGFNFVRMGSLSRVVVQCSSGVLALAGTVNPQNLSWDPVNGILVPYAALSGSTVAVSTAVYANGVITVTTGSAHGLTTGNFATLAGNIPTAFNVSGAVTVSSSTVFTIPAAINPGTLTTPGTAQAGLGGFKATIVSVDTNSAIVNYNSGTGVSSWNNTGNAAVILI